MAISTEGNNWHRVCGVTLLLPGQWIGVGYDGSGPELMLEIGVVS